MGMLILSAFLYIKPIESRVELKPYTQNNWMSLNKNAFI